MSDAPILTEKHGHVMTITLNRPEAMNAITPHMLQDLNQAFKDADDDIDARVVLLTGAGRAFCSGLDLKQASAGEGISGSLSRTDSASHYSTREICTVTLQRMDTPVIGVINGAAAGYGLDPRARMRHAANGRRCKAITRLRQDGGHFWKVAGTWYLPRLLGWAKACEIAMLGDPSRLLRPLITDSSIKPYPAQR